MPRLCLKEDGSLIGTATDADYGEGVEVSWKK